MSLVTRVLLGIIAGSILWTVGVIQDGPDQAAFRVVFGVIFNLFFSLLMIPLGLFLRLPAISRFWWQLQPILVVIIAASAMTIIFAGPLGLTHQEADPDDSGHMIRVMNWSWIPLTTQFLVVFPIVNWPRRLVLQP